MKNSNNLTPKIRHFSKNDILLVSEVQKFLSGKWKLLILMTLFDRPKRFKEIASLVGITDKVLSVELKDMERKQLISRTVYDSYPALVEYAATPFSFTLTNVLRELCEWSLVMNKKKKRN